ncbi:HD family phosphohydrolase [Shouchella shacheensis]|uniref:HD family phosphohydrolase n=1 Tax=Shouchella shacheensis TaxID=1649580 RepID=UPI00073FE403|nr:HD family phosphohydrolase [Shouchella shacheensis]
MDKKEKPHGGWWKKKKHQRSIRAVILSMLAILMYVLMLDNVIPERLDVHLSEQATEDIRSPLTVENTEKTEQRRNEAVSAVGSSYEQKREYEQRQVTQVKDLFAYIGQVQEDAEEESEGDVESPPPLEDQLDSVREVLSNQANADLSESTLEAFLTASEAQLDFAEEAATNALHEAMSGQIGVSDLQEVQEEAEAQISSLPSLNANLRAAVNEVVQTSIIPNYIYDAEATQEQQQEAAEAVEPVLIREGELIVAEGDVINRDVYEQLRLVGLLDESFVVYPYIGLGLLVLIIMGMLVYFMRESRTTVTANRSHLLMYAIVFSLMLLILKLFSFMETMFGVTGLGFVVPVAAGAMLLTLLIHTRLAILTSVIFAIVGSVFYNHDSASTFAFTYGLYILASSLTATFFLNTSNKPTRILTAGLLVAGTNVLTVLCLLFVKSTQGGWVEVGMQLGAGLLSGIVASVLTIGLLPFFETGFGILSVSRLIELSNPNHPLLRKILTEAPGTYHHSVVVGNLAEAACEKLGENGLLARVGAYYHDLGKTRRPHFFIENQFKGENPHDKISPQLSKTIIISHPYDGARLLREHKMPQEIVDIAEQHHGTSLLKFFYHKANQDSEQPQPESQFRYPGPKPQTKVTSVISIADSVEAAVRSMQKPTPDKMEMLVDKIIKDKLEDGQFDESDLTLKELNDIKVSMCETLKGTFHQRIEYPDEKGKEEN